MGLLSKDSLLDLSNTDFCYWDLSKLNLCNINFCDMKFEYANLLGAQLREANVKNATFQGAKLSDDNRPVNLRAVKNLYQNIVSIVFWMSLVRAIHSTADAILSTDASYAIDSTDASVASIFVPTILSMLLLFACKMMINKILSSREPKEKSDRQKTEEGNTEEDNKSTAAQKFSM